MIINKQRQFLNMKTMTIKVWIAGFNNSNQSSGNRKCRILDAFCECINPKQNRSYKNSSRKKQNANPDRMNAGKQNNQIYNTEKTDHPQNQKIKKAARSFCFGYGIFFVKNKPYINYEITNLKNKSQKDKYLASDVHRKILQRRGKKSRRKIQPFNNAAAYG